MPKKVLEDHTAPGTECTWRLVHNDGTEKVTRGHTAFFAAQAAGWKLSQCALIELTADEDDVPKKKTAYRGCPKCHLTWNGRCGEENCPRRK